MKSIYFKLLAIVFCFAFITSSAFAQDSALKEKFQKMNNEMIKAMLADNTEFMMAMYTDDAISMPSYEPMLKGKDAMMQSHMKNKEAGFKMNDMTLTTMDAWSSGDYAYEIGMYTIDMSMPGMEGWKDNGKYLTVWEKQSDGYWKVKAETWNSDNNPWANMDMHEEDMDDSEEE
jgi:ketosteroid isomerase-like protein